MHEQNSFEEEDLKSELRRKLAKYKMPHIIRPIKKIPRTRNCKIKRSQLKKDFENKMEFIKE